MVAGANIAGAPTRAVAAATARGVWHSFDDNDVRVPVHGVVGRPVEPGRPVALVLASHDRVTAVDGAPLGTVWAGVVALDMGARQDRGERVLDVQRVPAGLGPLVPVGGRAPAPLMGVLAADVDTAANDLAARVLGAGSGGA